MSANTVHVKNIASATEDKEIRDFFSFCGKITDLQVTPSGDTKDAVVTFEKETAAKTALLLNNTQLGSSQINVTSATGDQSDDGSHFANTDPSVNRDTDDIAQEDKPRARILAEYLAHGYVVGDVALQRAIELDAQHGISKRFLDTLQSLDQKYHATDRARATDQTYGLTARAQGFFGGLNSYFEKAANSPTGKRIVQFYTDSQRQVNDIHAEARRLADLKKDQHGGSAYKAAGLEKVFGKEKEQAVPPATGETVGTMAPTQPDDTTAVPLSKPGAADEKA
ncbi:RNA recognition domain-containing protein [Sodiomyces alkalinus F11]|uniref:RNA recognition domain-containing protein n=1 Tax=Sodiomyces alkalinus (strain CBS 110278 / VKM F-3762 / F11) TaxID=1314773 RepID=A0A3N2Q785_SODAK|nr:RNA recognition domain-containing protein [Sodiomyces alkalinus F11]ROT42602.1 RNA recognition domain-containing protein [Sodiomyces alkalinus F11]